MARAVLIMIIIAMLLVSIHPFAVRKICLLVLAVLGLSSALCFADPVFMTRQHAPSGAQTRPARIVMASRVNLEAHSLIWNSRSSSAVPPNGLSIFTLRPSLGETGDRMDSVSLTGSADFLALGTLTSDSRLTLVSPAGVRQRF
jgi:hypothetical protein